MKLNGNEYKLYLYSYARNGSLMVGVDQKHWKKLPEGTAIAMAQHKIFQITDRHHRKIPVVNYYVIAELFKNDTLISVGFSFCSPLDKPNRKRGRREAIVSALKKAGMNEYIDQVLNRR